MVPPRPGNAGGGKDPDFWRAFNGGEDEVIGGEPANTRTDPDPPAKAVSQGEGGAGLPLLPALRQDPSRGHPEPRLRARLLQRGRAGGGRDHVRDDRGVGSGGVAGRSPGRPRCEDVQAPAGAAGDDPEARGRREAARDPDHSGPGGSDRRQAGSGADLRGGPRSQCLWLSPGTGRSRRDQGSAPALVPGLYRRGRCRSVGVLRHDPSPGADAISRPADCGPACAVADQAVAQGSGRGARRHGNAAPDGRPGEHLRRREGSSAPCWPTCT
jgi:hypothetical protein